MLTYFYLTSTCKAQTFNAHRMRVSFVALKSIGWDFNFPNLFVVKDHHGRRASCGIKLFKKVKWKINKITITSIKHLFCFFLSFSVLRRDRCWSRRSSRSRLSSTSAWTRSLSRRRCRSGPSSPQISSWRTPAASSRSAPGSVGSGSLWRPQQEWRLELKKCKFILHQISVPM